MDSRNSGTAIELEAQNPSTVSYPTTSNAAQVDLSRQHSQIVENTVIEQQLEPADGGAAAWKVLCAAFMFEAVLWGFAISFGVFQDYYTKLPAYQGNPFVSIVGTLGSGLPYLGGPVMAVIVRRYQNYRFAFIWLGWPVCILGIVASSFAGSLGPLIVTQGVMYGVGFVIFYYPIIGIVNEWWIARRGLAFGLITSAAGVSGIVMPLLIETLLVRYGHRTTLRAVAVAMALLTGPLIPLLKSRLPPSQIGVITRTDWSFASKPLFFIYCSASILQGLGFFFPALFLPSYTTSIGLSGRQGAMLLSVMSAAQVLGQWTFGVLSDKLGLNFLILVSTVITAVASFTSWGLAHDLAPLVVFALLFGFFAYGFSSMRARMGMAVSEEPTAALATFSILNCCQGLGTFLAGPISAGLLSGKVRRDGYGLGRYGGVIAFQGACMLLSALSIGTWYIRPRRIRAA